MTSFPPSLSRRPRSRLPYVTLGSYPPVFGHHGAPSRFPAPGLLFFSQTAGSTVTGWGREWNAVFPRSSQVGSNTVQVTKWGGPTLDSTLEKELHSTTSPRHRSSSGRLTSLRVATH